jgi:peroxiredoxin
MRSDDLYSIPAGLTAPVDDGTCAHLVGREIPAIGLPSTGDRTVDLQRISSPWVVVYAYPRTGLPDVSTPPGWDTIPGARGCTPQSCAYRDHHRELAAEGVLILRRGRIEQVFYPVFPPDSDAERVLLWLRTQPKAV